MQTKTCARGHGGIRSVWGFRIVQHVLADGGVSSMRIKGQNASQRAGVNLTIGDGDHSTSAHWTPPPS